MKPLLTSHRDYRDQAARFRAQATGIGQSLSASEQTGARRSQVVADTPGSTATAKEGYPPPTPEYPTLPIVNSVQQIRKL
jgi:hypothetical protein